MKIAIGCDHGGDNLRPIIAEYLQELGHDVIEYSPKSGESTDYPQYGKMVAEDVVANKVEAGILICGTGVGISIAANKVKGIRAVVCSEPATARLSKQHNNTNILAFGGRIVGSVLAKEIVKAWLDAEFEGGRHARRIGMIADIEEEFLC